MKTFFITAALILSFLGNAQELLVNFSQTSLKNDPSQWISVVHSGYYGFVDKTGKEVVPTIYDSIEPFGVYKKDWAMVSKDGLKGFINDKGEAIVPPAYDEIGKFGVYMEYWALVNKAGYYGFINTEGKEIVEAKYEEIPLKTK